MKSILAITLAILLTSATQSAAQPAAADDAGRNLAAPANLTAGTVAGVAAGDPVQGQPRAAVQFLLDASNDLKTGIASIGWKDGAKNHFLLTFSGPVDSRTKEAQPISLLGLPAGASVKTSVNRLMWSGPNEAEQKEIKAMCEDLLKRKITPCFTNNTNIPSAELEKLRDLLHEEAPIWFFGGDYTEERSSFRFLQRGTLTPGAENHRGWNVNGRLGYYTPLGFVFGTYSRKVGYVAGGATTDVCQPIGGTASLTCAPAVIGAPREMKFSVGGIELRKFFSDLPVAIAPSVQRDFENDVTGVDVPIYFLKATTGLIGGVRFNWRSDTEAVTAVMFVGTAIGILPQ
jgi:hypothetical protein